MSNIDTVDVPETDAEVEAILDANSPEAPAEPAPEAATDAPEEAANAEAPAPPATVPAPRTGNAAWPEDTIRDQVKGMMDKLREAGYTRPELSTFTGFNDSTVWRAQNRKVHAVELDAWMALFERFAKNELPAPKTSLRKPKVEALQAKIDELVTDHDARLKAITEALSGEAKTVAQYRKLVEAALELLPQTEAPVEAPVEATASA